MAIVFESCRVAKSHVARFTNCRLVRDGKMIKEDLWVDTKAGKIIEAPAESEAALDGQYRTIDLQGHILAAGFIDLQINGWGGFDFSIPSDNYAAGFGRVCKLLAQTGVTSFLPTMTSQTSEEYRQILPHLAPSRDARDPQVGAESLGAHVEGPFISPLRNGVHCAEVLATVTHGFSDLADRYGVENLQPTATSPATIKLITGAPELGSITSEIPNLRSNGIIFSIGHSNATLSQAVCALDAGASMVTHLFNAMRPFAHRDPGIIGTLEMADEHKRPYFSIIADGIHNHPIAVRMAHSMHSKGLILVTDAMMYTGMPDGTYPWTNGDYVTKAGPCLNLVKNGRIAGSTVTLIECVNNLMAWTKCSIAEAISAVTETPAKLLGLRKKGNTNPGADADLVVLEDKSFNGYGVSKLEVEQVWKFGGLIFAKGATNSIKQARKMECSAHVKASVAEKTSRVLV